MHAPAVTWDGPLHASCTTTPPLEDEELVDDDAEDDDAEDDDAEDDDAEDDDAEDDEEDAPPVLPDAVAELLVLIPLVADEELAEPLEETPPDALPPSVLSARPGWQTPSTQEDARSQSPLALQVRAHRPSTLVSPSAQVLWVHAEPHAQSTPHATATPSLRVISACPSLGQPKPIRLRQTRPPGQWVGARHTPTWCRFPASGWQKCTAQAALAIRASSGKAAFLRVRTERGRPAEGGRGARATGRTQCR